MGSSRSVLGATVDSLADAARKRALRPHQVEAVDAVERALSVLAEVPAGGLRASVVAACGTGKTLMAAHAARRLVPRGRVLVLVPTLDLLAQTVAGWREAGHDAQFVGVCSLARGQEQGLRCTTSAPQLAWWLADGAPAVVFATYASLPVLLDAHEGPFGITALAQWDLVVVDEAHRTSGHIGKAWAKVHDNSALPALRRLYLTATPRVWQAAPARARAGMREALPAQMVASMDDEALFGPVVYRLPLSEAIDRGLLAAYEVVVLELRDRALYEAVSAAAADRRNRRLRRLARQARTAAAQTAVVRACTELGLERVLTFHHRTGDAAAFAQSLPDTARTLAEVDPRVDAQGWWTGWLYGEHEPEYRRQVLRAFAQPRTAAGTPARHAVLSSVKVLAEGVDLASDAVVFVDPKTSAVDVVQAVGRALRQQPGQGKLARLVVPVFLPPDQPLLEGEELLLSPAFDHLVAVIQALRSHDENVVEQLAIPQVPSQVMSMQASSSPSDGNDQTASDDGDLDVDALERDTGDGAGERAPARRSVLRFQVPRSPQALAAFVRLRVLRPETRAWRRGVDAAARWRRVHHHLRVPVDAMDGPFPLGRWLADQRRLHAQGQLAAERVEELEAQGMVWSVPDAAWDAGLARARQWAGLHGHLAAPVTAVQDGYPVGRWLAEQRTAARQPVTQGGLASGRRRALDAIDPYWNPPWPLTWQRTYRMLAAHLAPGARVEETAPRLRDWVRSQLRNWEQLAPGQLALLADLGFTPAVADAGVPVRRRSQDERFALGLEAARAFREREGHLDVPRRHREQVREEDVPLGVWINNQRARRAHLPEERIAALSELGMRWA